MFMVFHVAEAREPWGNSILPPFPTLSPSPTSSPSSSPTATFQYGCRRCLVATPPWGAAGAVVIIFFSLFAVNDLTIFDFTAFSFRTFWSKIKRPTKISRRARKILLTSSISPPPGRQAPPFSSQWGLLYWNELLIFTYIGEFAVNCFQLRIKLYDLYVPVPPPNCDLVYSLFQELQTQDSNRIDAKTELKRMKWKNSNFVEGNPKTFIILARKISEHVNGWLGGLIYLELTLLAGIWDICFRDFILINWAINLIGLCWKHHKAAKGHRNNL